MTVSAGLKNYAVGCIDKGNIENTAEFAQELYRIL